MRIEKVYKTSKGTFWSKVDAEKKTNRAKTYGSRPGDPIEYEPVQEAFVLIAAVQNYQGIVTGSCAFELSKVDVE